MATKPHEKRYDPARLQSMVEPIAVRVEKLKGNTRQPIELPAKFEGGSPGANWTREEIAKLENWLLTEWSGGGMYNATVVDSAGNKMEWDFYYDPRMFPERVPPSAMTATGPAPVGAPQNAYSFTPQAPPAFSMPFGPSAQPLGQAGPTGWPPPGAGYAPVMPTPYMPSAPPAAPGPWNTPTPWGATSWSSPWQPTPWGHPQQIWPQPAAHAPDEHTRIRQLEEEVRKTERDRSEERHRMDMERMQQTHANEIGAMREELRRFAEATGKQPVGESDELRRLREENERQRQAFVESQLKAMQDMITKLAEKPVNTGETDEIRRLREEQAHQKQDFERSQERLVAEAQRERDRIDRERAEERHRIELEKMNDKFERTVEVFRDESKKGPDPIIEFMRDNSRNQAETAKEIARTQQAASDRMAGFMMNPIQMATLMKEASSSTDQILRSVTGVVDIYQKVAENAVALSGGAPASPAAALIQEGLSKAAEVAQQWLAVQRDRAVHDARARSEQSRAQAHVADAVRAQAEGQTRVGQVTPAAGQTFNGAQGMPLPAPANGAVRKPKAPKPGAAAPMPPMPPVVVGPPRTSGKRGPSDEKMFGVVYPEVQHLRQGVADGKLTPTLTVDAILQGVSATQQARLTIPVFTLFEQGRFADLMDALLPEAPQLFRDECVAVLNTRLNEEVDDPDDDDDGDDGDDGADDNDGMAADEAISGS